MMKWHDSLESPRQRGRHLWQLIEEGLGRNLV
jgi:hypothetical protein